MNFKEREREIHRAKELLRSQQTKIAKRGSRIHEEAMADRVARLRALEGDLCPTCQGLRIEIVRYGKLTNVSLRCRYRGSPLELYRLEANELGEKPKCELRIPIEAEEQKPKF